MNKWEVRDKIKQQRKEWRQQRWRQIKCFWTRPLFHKYNVESYFGYISLYECVGCGKEKVYY